MGYKIVNLEDYAAYLYGGEWADLALAVAKLPAGKGIIDDIKPDRFTSASMSLNKFFKKRGERCSLRRIKAGPDKGLTIISRIIPLEEEPAPTPDVRIKKK